MSYSFSLIMMYSLYIIKLQSVFPGKALSPPRIVTLVLALTLYQLGIHVAPAADIF